MESPFKTPSKVFMFEMIPSSGSSSPFTPRRSKIKRKINEEFNSVSRALTFDDSNSDSPFKRSLEYLPLSQQVPYEYDNIKSEPTTPVKTDQPSVEKNNKILFSPSIKNRPNRFNIDEQQKNAIKPSPNKRSLNKTTPSKKCKSNIMENCKPITFYFKPSQKRHDFKIDNIFQSTNHISNEENMNPKMENIIKSELSTYSIEPSKPVIFNEIQSSKESSQSLNFKNMKSNESPKKKCNEIQVNYNKSVNNIIQSPKKYSVNSSLQIEKKESPRKKAVTSTLSNENIIKQVNVSEQVTPSKSGSINTNVLKSPIIDYFENKVTISGGDTYSRFIKSIVLKPELVCLGKNKIFKTIESSTDDELKIYGRLISRKHGWIRANESDGLNKYRELNLCNDFDGVLISLASKQLINTDVNSCELECLLNILKSQELKELQKSFNINLISNKRNTKPEMIKSFLQLVKNQKTFCGNSIQNLKERVKKKMGFCLKLSDESRDDIMSCLIYESYPYFSGEEKDRFRDCFTKFNLVEKKLLKFPIVPKKRVTVNFNSNESLEMYKIALNLRYEVQLFLEQKDYENAILLLKIIFEKFKSAVCDKFLIDSFSKIPTYMRKYSAISVYTHTLFKNISILKKSTNDKDLAKVVLEFLIKHKEFLISKQADLHIELAKVLESQYKQLNLAAKVIISGLKDDTMSELDRQMLSNRAVMYANRKVRKLDNELKKELSTLITVTKELPSVTISGKIMSTNKVSSGLKQVYSKRTENGDVQYMSVEELALSHYKSQGFINGIHDEGQFLKSMFFLCFWDIIYSSYSDHTLFISQYQDCPLDWRTRHFYKIREEKIKGRMTELKQMTVDQIYDTMKECYDSNCNTQSVINWNFMNNLPMSKVLLECLGIKVFLAIGNQILENGRIYLHGMPDLIVWDAVKHKCMFVEVKGPNDKLSERQYSWLLKLIEFGAHVEVCHVIGTGGKHNTCNDMDVD